MSADDETLGDYLLGELDADAHARFERRLAEDPTLRAEVERLAPAVAKLERVPDAAWAALPVPPPVPRVLGADMGAGTGAGTGPAGARRRRIPGLHALPARTWGLAAAASIALLAVGVAIGVVVGDDGGGRGAGATARPEAPAVALAPLGAAPAGAGAEARMVGPNRMLLTIRKLPPSAPGTYYEAWLLNRPGDLVPVASFHVGDRGSAIVEVPLPAAADAYRFLDISLQRVDGGTAHSGRSVLRGTLS